MAKIRKFVKGLYQYGNLFKIANPTEVVGDAEVKQITPYRGVIQKQGDIITAEDHNEIQRNGVLFVSAEYSENYGVGVDAYVIKDYYNEQGIFDGLKLKFQIPRTNMYTSPVIILDNLKYNLKIINNNILEDARKGELNKNEIVSVIFLNGSFVLETSKAGINSRGITSYGITEDTALEGNKWLETIGGQFGGYVSKVQNKEAGKLYINDVYDNKLYVCVTAHNSTSFDITKYRDITNNGISDQLKNLYEVKTVNVNLAGGFIKFIKKGNLVHAFLFVESANYNIRFSDDTLMSNYPPNFIPDLNYLNTEYAVIAEEINNKVGNTRLVLRNNGITIFGTSNNSYKAIKGTAVYSV